MSEVSEVSELAELMDLQDSATGGGVATDELQLPGVEDVVELRRRAWATIYRVRDTATSKVVDVHVLHPEAVSPQAAQRYLEEQSSLASLCDHPHIVTVHGSGRTADARPFVAVDEAPDRNALDLVRGSHTGAQVLSLAIQAAGALESVHRGGFTHGNVHPESMHLLDDRVVLSDFGLTHLTDHDRRAQELDWHVAPELHAGELATPESDQYSLAASIHYLISGRPPLGPASIDMTSPMPTTCLDLAPFGAPDALTNVLSRALAVRPEQRWLDTEDFGRALQEVEIWIGTPVTPMTIDTPSDQVQPTWPAKPPKPLLVDPAPTNGAPAAPTHSTSAPTNSTPEPVRRPSESRDISWQAKAAGAASGAVIVADLVAMFFK